MTLLNPVDEGRVLTLSRLAATAESQGLKILLLGAFARDLLFWHMHGIECRRETLDVDIVVQLEDWAAFHKYRNTLIAQGFQEDAKADHPEKLTDTQTGVVVDLLPFGEIAEDGKTVIWPEDNSQWSVVGIQDAYDHALQFEISAAGVTHSVRFISIPALVLLKIVAAHERPAARAKKDTVDIGFVVNQYLGIGNKKRLDRPPHNDILDAVGVDLDRATARLLGRDIGSIVSESTKAHVVKLLAKVTETRSECLFTQGIQRALCRGDFARARLIICDILDGLMWHPPEGT